MGCLSGETRILTVLFFQAKRLGAFLLKFGNARLKECHTLLLSFL